MEFFGNFSGQELMTQFLDVSLEDDAESSLSGEMGNFLAHHTTEERDPWWQVYFQE